MARSPISGSRKAAGSLRRSVEAAVYELTHGLIEIGAPVEVVEAEDPTK